MNIWGPPLTLQDCLQADELTGDNMYSCEKYGKLGFDQRNQSILFILWIDCPYQVHMYNLYSCIVHYGRAGSGHYITYCLNQQWYEYDGENVRQADAATVQNAEVYVLFYRYFVSFS